MIYSCIPLIILILGIGIGVGTVILRRKSNNDENEMSQVVIMSSIKSNEFPSNPIHINDFSKLLENKSSNLKRNLKGYYFPIFLLLIIHKVCTQAPVLRNKKRVKLSYISMLLHYSIIGTFSFEKIIEKWVTHPISTNTSFGTLLSCRRRIKNKIFTFPLQILRFSQ